MKSIKNADFKGLRVLARFDFNVPLTKDQPTKVKDSTRIDLALPTIKKILSDGPKKLIMMSHLGRPQGEANPKYSLEPVASFLAEALGEEVMLTEAPRGVNLEQMIQTRSPRLILLENLRFDSGEESGDKDFAKEIAEFGDVYVNDAFGAAHRKHASVYSILQFFKNRSYAGLLMEREVEILSQMMSKPKKPFVALLGGAKVSDKIKTIHRLLPIVDELLIGGAMAYPFLKAQGFHIGKSLCSDDDFQLAQKLLKEKLAQHKLKLPLDHICAASFEAQSGETSTDANINSDLMGLDIGPRTIEKYQKLMEGAQTIFWNGPMGKFETKAFAKGSQAMAQALANSKGLTVVGGGDSVACLQETGLAEKISHVSTGGGASLEFIENGRLPGVDALKYEWSDLK